MSHMSPPVGQHGVLQASFITLRQLDIKIVYDVVMLAKWLNVMI